MASEEQRKKWREAGARYRAAHPERELERSRKQIAADPAAYRERKRTESAARAERNPERAAELRRASYTRNKAYYPEWRKKNPDKVKAANRKWGAEYARHQHRKAKYGITREQYESMVEEQKGKCAICRKPETAFEARTKKPRSLAVDHCHDTGKIRGLLCYRCNVAIGLMQHNEAILEMAIEYLEKSR